MTHPCNIDLLNVKIPSKLEQFPRVFHSYTGVEFVVIFNETYYTNIGFTKIFNTNHAFCLETNNGAEIVVHMGIDTVALEGKGFKRLVEEGTDVKAGEPILEMDLDFLNANARSMISPVVCSNSDDYSALVILASGKVVAGQTPRYEIKGK